MLKHGQTMSLPDEGTNREEPKKDCAPLLPQLLVRHIRTHTIDGPSDNVDALLEAAAAKAGVPLKEIQQAALAAWRTGRKNRKGPE